MSQFDDVIAERIRDLQGELATARVGDCWADEARIECELADLQRLQGEHSA